MSSLLDVYVRPFISVFKPCGLIYAQDFYVIPSPNPDGYDYTWESDRYWYKNRQIMGPNAKCIGLDMNRFAFTIRLTLHAERDSFLRSLGTGYADSLTLSD